MKKSLYHSNVKRFVDLIIGSILIILLCPLMIVIYVGIVCSTPGGALFFQERIGKDGKLFRVFKFRTMHRYQSIEMKKAATQLSHNRKLLKLDPDPRVTFFGKLLRRSSFDELPQLFNVLLGDMSLVGPRPLVSFMVNLDDPRSCTRHSVLPGITGYWQIYARHLNTSIESMYPYDLRYVAEISPLVDLKILWLTIPTVISKRGAW